MKDLREIVNTLLPHGPFDAVGVGVIDFSQGRFESFVEGSTEDTYFDLASLTKPLTNSLSYFLDPKSFSPDMLLCLSHRGGLPSWGLLPHEGWREQILSYKIQTAETLYSDFSALRVMLELQKLGLDPKKVCSSVWSKETIYWLDLPSSAKTLQYGYKNGEPNFGAVHDPNAWVIHDFCSHAGLFSTVSGVCETLLNFNQKTDFISKTARDLQTHTHRFSYGWDRVIDPKNTLAGSGCGTYTFGHLGFTGTSIWIDPVRLKGHVILSNSTKCHWFDKQVLNDLRRAIGTRVWG